MRIDRNTFCSDDPFPTASGKKINRRPAASVTRLSVRSAVLGDADGLATCLSPMDVRTIRAVSGEEPLRALRRHIDWSEPCHAIVDQEDRALGVFGAIPDDNIRSHRSGTVWFLRSDRLDQHHFMFLRHSRPWVLRLGEDYDVLWNYVDARNEAHIRWLQWCGFTLLRLKPDHGVEQRPFWEFERDFRKDDADRPG